MPNPSPSRSLPEVSQDKEGQEIGPDLSDEKEQSARWFREAVGVYEVQKEAADHIEVDPAYLNHQCRGLKPVNLTHLERMRRRKPKAFQRVVEAMALDGDMTVVLRVELELSPDVRRLLFVVREAIGPMWPPIRDLIAARIYRCRGELLDSGIDYEALRK